jgi:energy-coupling factor transporter ATP-binding protein EcfA2
MQFKKNQKEIMNGLKELKNNKESDLCFLPPPKALLVIGRDIELKELNKKIKENDIVVVNGIGGLGKTELCKKYIEIYKEDYNKTIWIPFIGSIKKSFINEVKGLTKQDLKPKELYAEIISHIDKPGENVLVIIDNANDLNNEDLKDISCFPFKVILTSRQKYESLPEYNLSFLSDKNCLKLFCKHYGEVYDEDIDIVKKIITEKAGKHTLIIELLAKAAKNGMLSIKELDEFIEKEGFCLKEKVKKQLETDEEIIMDHLIKLFKIAGLSSDEENVLINLSLIQGLDINKKLFKELIEIETHNPINSLIDRGWINYNNDNIQMHQAIAVVIRNKYKPDMAGCKTMVQNLTNKIHYTSYDNPLLKSCFLVYSIELYKI